MDAERKPQKLLAKLMIACPLLPELTLPLDVVLRKVVSAINRRGDVRLRFGQLPEEDGRGR